MTFSTVLREISLVPDGMVFPGVGMSEAEAVGVASDSAGGRDVDVAIGVAGETTGGMTVGFGVAVGRQAMTSNRPTNAIENKVMIIVLDNLLDVKAENAIVLSQDGPPPVLAFNRGAVTLGIARGEAEFLLRFLDHTQVL